MAIPFPEEFAQMMQALEGVDARALLDALQKPPVKGLRLNALKPSKKLSAWAGALPAVPWCADGRIAPEDFRPGASPLHAAGLFYMQEPAAMAPAEALCARPGERVLDLCAAPGGKTGQLAAAMRGKGVLIANEIHSGRARVLLENLERLGVQNAVVLNETPARILRHFGRWFDAVLVDAPCSGEGMFRRDEDARRQWSRDYVRLCQSRQREILDCAAGLLRPGGRLVYSTCTFNALENEENVRDFLLHHPDFCQAGPARRLLPSEVAGEGQFYAPLQYIGSEAQRDLLALPTVPPAAQYEDFARRFLQTPWEGPFLRAGDDWLYGVSDGVPTLSGLHVLRTGLQLGQLRKGRFEPAHALALWARKDAFIQHMELDEEQAQRYLRGETLEGEISGWGVVCTDGWPLGLVKGTQGVLKNHYPKGLRITKV